MSGRQSRGGARTRHTVRDWAAYDGELARRDDIAVWVSAEATAGWRAPAGRCTFSDAAITAALTVRAIFRLVPRQVAGLTTSVFGLLGVALRVPDHTTLSRCGWALRPDRRIVVRGRLDLARDRTGLHVARPRGAGNEGWRTLHIAVDPDSGTVLAEELTRSAVHDSVPVPVLLGAIDADLRRVHGDGA